MNNLSSLKDWFSISESAHYLSRILNDEISEADVYRLAIDGYLKLSLYFVNSTDAAYIIKSTSKTEERSCHLDDHLLYFQICYSGDFVLDDFPMPISGLWDVRLIGNGKLAIEKRYHKITTDLAVELSDYSSIFLVNDRGDNVFLLQPRPYSPCPNDHFPDPPPSPPSFSDFDQAIDFPPEGLIVVKKEALVKFHKQILDKKNTNDKPLDPRTERTYLNIIGVLLEMVTGTFKDEIFSSETQLRDFIAEKFDDLRGVRPRNTADIFAAAKRALNGELD